MCKSGPAVLSQENENESINCESNKRQPLYYSLNLEFTSKIVSISIYDLYFYIATSYNTS